MTITSSRRGWLLPIASVAVLAVLAGCGGGSAPPTAAPQPSPSSSAAGSAPPPGGTAPTPSSTVDGQSPVPVENNPPGDIPDNLAFVPYRNPAGGYGFTFPEGWARSERGTTVTFTSKLNGIAADSAGVPADLSVAAVRAQEVPRLRKTRLAFELRTVEPVSLPGGRGVRVVYRRNSAPDPVTGKQVRDEVESYLIGTGAKRVRLDLVGPVGADNVDAYRTISQSLVLG